MADIVLLALKIRGDDVTVRGTVDGRATEAHAWKSHLQPLTKAQRRAFLAAALKAVDDAVQPVPDDTTIDISGPVITL